MGSIPGVRGAVYSDLPVAPRLGFTFDLLGDKTTILKGHYGEFTDGVNASMLDQMNPDRLQDKITYYWDSDAGWGLVRRSTGSSTGRLLIDPESSILS